MTRRPEVVDVEVILFHATERAALAWTDEDREKAVWLPLSEIELYPIDGAADPRIHAMTLPTWLAEERALA